MPVSLLLWNEACLDTFRAYATHRTVRCHLISKKTVVTNYPGIPPMSSCRICFLIGNYFGLIQHLF